MSEDMEKLSAYTSGILINLSPFNIYVYITSEGTHQHTGRCIRLTLQVPNLIIPGGDMLVILLISLWMTHQYDQGIPQTHVNPSSLIGYT